MEGNDRALLKGTILTFVWKDLGKERQTSGRIAGLLVEI
jgi:hypothetical protein